MTYENRLKRKPRRERKMKCVLFYGDSNTYGYDPRDPYDDRYPASVRWTDRLGRALEGRWEVISRGQNGRCVPSLPQMEGYLCSLIETGSPSGAPDRFAVMLGTNDLLRTYRPDAAPAVRQMDALLSFLQTRFPEMERMLIAPPILFDGVRGDAFFLKCQEESRKLTAAYKKLAAETGTIFADAGRWGIEMSSDGVHFSERGHAQFAAAIEAYFV